MVNVLAAHQVIEYAHREPAEWLFGLRGPDGYLMCGLRPDVPLTKARRELSRHGSALAEPIPPLDLGPPKASPASPLVSLRGLLDMHGSLAGIFLRSPGGASNLLRHGAPEGLSEQITQFTGLFDLTMSRPGDHVQPAATPVSPGTRLVLPRVHLLGTRAGVTSLWLALCPSTREGLGWGLLTSARVLFHRQ
jgi:hypothetical protein